MKGPKWRHQMTHIPVGWQLRIRLKIFDLSSAMICPSGFLLEIRAGF